ncbi:scm-like with four MBT domains protein 1 [Haliotis cracherodii]|uniref:scm-like with four MBT domains protein 1 n=1 Tax=Haliotis cracherodii TaxID=6455 RepID=UPI0039E80428
MTAPGPGQSHFGTGMTDLPVSGADAVEGMKLATSMAAITSPITPEGLLSAQSLGAVTIPQSFCFPQTSLSSAFSSSQQAPPGTPSPLNVTLGFPMNVNTGAVGHPFVQPISVGQICTTVAQSLGIPISQTILAVPNGGQGQFLSGAFSQLQPIIMSAQQQPVMANPFMGAPQNGSVTPLAASPNTFSLNSITAPALLPKELIFENIAESGNESEGNFSNETPKQEMGDLADVESILNITSMDDGGIQNDIEMPDSENSNSTKEDVKSNAEDSPAPVEDVASPKPSPVPSDSEKMEEESNSVTEEAAPDAGSVKEEEEEESPLPEQKPLEEVKAESPYPAMEDNTELVDPKVESLDDLDDKSRFCMIDTADYNEDGIPVEYDQSEFIWEEYLLETGSTSVPPTAFTHVECSLQSGFVKGMKLEVPNKSSPNTYWVASVIMSCGQLLRLRYDGYEEDGSADFWADLMTSEIHPVGWCSSNGRTLQPPDAIKDKFSDWKEFVVASLTGARTAPPYLLDKMTGTTPVDQLKQCMRLEIQDVCKPTNVWVVQIIENVGGRLYLRYEGVESGTHDFWMFYLNESLHPIGWAKEMKYTYKPPKEVEKSFMKCSEAEINEILEEGLKMTQDQILPADIFKDQPEIPTHKFQKGWKIEALNPLSRNQICPATIIQIFNSRYFLVEIDSLERHSSKRVQFSCHANSPNIFPIHWCQCKGLRLTHPAAWSKPDFSWSEYLAYCNAQSAPDAMFDLTPPVHEFEKGMKLEAVNPDNQNQICAATITKIVDGLMWIHLDISMKIVASHIESIESQNLFPVGWCESNGYQLKPPRKLGLKRPIQKRVAVVQPEIAEGPWNEENKSESYSQVKNGESGGSGWCPKIYFNHRCFSGPYLSKGRISELPKCVGPGPINLVMKEVLSMLINVAYKSCRVLREIQMEGSPNPNMHQQVLKAKYKGKSYRATVEICKSTSQLEEFCRQICIKLECCPNLISPHLFTTECPEICSQLTKTKYTYYYGKKKKKVGRPPGGHTNLEDGPKKPGKRRKRKKINFVTKKVRTSQDENDDCIDDDKDSVNSDTRTVDSTSTNGSKDKDLDLKQSQGLRIKRKYTHHVPPPSDIRTRGAKLPKYSFERRTHKKIMLTSHHGSSHHHGNSSIVTKSQSALGLGMNSKHGSGMSRKHQDSSVKKEEILRLEKNPLKWSLSDVVEFIKTTDCAHLARLFKEQEIDGQALLLLTLPTVQEHLDLKLGPAIKLCHHIERVKIAFYETFAK